MASETWIASVVASGHAEAEVFYVHERGWSALRLGYHAGVGPYFSLPEALRRIEQIVGEAVWKPHRIEQDRPYAALKGSLRGDETDAEFDAAVNAQFPNENAKRSPSGDA